ncbi:MAG: dolichol-phosphate mannosyltransferase, partial [Acidobacteria bacterium]|nr:dolichol-phosphate mannosyltransferase [Acidobacteriota bacterium]
MAEITKTAPTQVISSTAKIALATLAVAAYFVGLTLPLMGPDEPRYAQVAREMFDRGDWVTPTLGGSLWFEKPVLLYWLEK